MSRHRLPLLQFFVLIFTALLAMPVIAQSGYPARQDAHVNDYAALLTAEEEAELSSMLQSVQTESGIEGVVVTVNSIAAYGTGDESIESFATNLFNRWGIDDEETNDGFLILVTAADRDVRIELGHAYGRRYDEAMQRVIDEEMLPAFREENYSDGILASTEATIAALTDPGGGGLWDRLRNSRTMQILVALAVLVSLVLPRLRYYRHAGCLRTLWELATAAALGAILGGVAGGLWDMVRGDVEQMQQTLLAMLQVVEDGRFLREFSLFAPTTLLGAGIGALAGIALRLIGVTGDDDDRGGGGGSSGGGGASGSW